MLPLNTFIDVARDGEYGKGFSVVAEEIGKLAMQSASYVWKIDEIVKYISSSVKNTVDEITKVRISSIATFAEENVDTTKKIASAI